MLSGRALCLASLLVLNGAIVVAQESKPTTEAQLKSAIADGVKLLIAQQENYILGLEPRPRRFKTPEDEKAWAARNQARIEVARKDGKAATEWPYEGVYRVGAEIPPGYRVGGTAIVCWSLMEVPGFDGDAARQAAVARGLDFAMHELETNDLLQNGFLGTYDVRGWAHAYGLHVLLRALELKAVTGERATRAKALIQKLIKTIEDTEIAKTGGWNYSRPAGMTKSNPSSTFMTAPTLQALFAAKKQGFAVKPEVIARGLDVLEKARVDSGAFQYGQSERGRTSPINTPAGSCARTAICEVTLLAAGRSSVDRVRDAVKAFFANWQFLEDRRRKPGTHEGPYAIAPYFFHYGHTYVAQAIEALPAAERAPLREQLYQLYWKTREADGGWNDREFPRSEGFGTAMAILGMLMPNLPEPARYVGSQQR